jgi:hypothetical protein
MKAGTASARTTFLEAAETAKALGAPEPFARAALGFGMAFEFMLMDRATVQRFTELVEAALRMLGAEDAPLRALLLSRLAMSLLLAPPERQREALERRAALSAEALTMARRLGNARVLAPVLCGRCLAVGDQTTWRSGLRSAQSCLSSPRSWVSRSCCWQPANGS